MGPLKERNRRGGMGLYYHIDMNGGPWNDRWVNTSPIPKLREQFHLAYETGIDDLWIVNVGDLKPKELPIDFILRYAWDPDAIPADRTDDYLRAWAGENFGEAHADAVAARARPCYPDRIPGAGRQRGRQRSHGAGRQPGTPCI